MTDKMLSQMQIVEAREAIHDALMALPRSVTWSAVASAAGVSVSAVSRFANAPDRCTIETVTAIGEAVQKLKGEVRP